MMDSIGKLNKAKYARAPNWDEIESFMKETGMCLAHFEKFYGMPFKSLNHVKMRDRNLAAKFWHFIYERIKPAYGAGFIVDYSPKEVKCRIKAQVSKQVTVESTTEPEFHGRFTTLK